MARLAPASRRPRRRSRHLPDRLSRGPARAGPLADQGSVRLRRTERRASDVPGHARGVTQAFETSVLTPWGPRRPAFQCVARTVVFGTEPHTPPPRRASSHPPEGPGLRGGTGKREARPFLPSTH